MSYFTGLGIFHAGSLSWLTLDGAEPSSKNLFHLCFSHCSSSKYQLCKRRSSVKCKGLFLSQPPLSVHVSSFQSSAPGQRADRSGALLETTGPGTASARQSSWRKCSRATRRASEVTFRRLFICTVMHFKPTHRTASCTATAQQLSSNWASTRRLWMMPKKLASLIPSGQR